MAAPESPNLDPNSLDQLLEEAVLAYLDAKASGTVDKAAIQARYAPVAKQLAEFFADEEAIGDCLVAKRRQGRQGDASPSSRRGLDTERNFSTLWKIPWVCRNQSGRDGHRLPLSRYRAGPAACHESHAPAAGSRTQVRK